MKPRITHTRSAVRMQLSLLLSASLLVVISDAGAQTAADYRTVRVVDTVINNTDSTLRTTDTFDDSEDSLAINPSNPNHLIALAFSGSLGSPNANAPLWQSLDAGQTWSKLFVITAPPGIPPRLYNQTLDWGKNDILSFSFLNSANVVSMTAINHGSFTTLNWFAPGGVTQYTNHNAPGSVNGADEPWVLVNRDPWLDLQDNTYVAFADFNNSDGIDGPDMRVAVSYGGNPPEFSVDRQVGNSSAGINHGLRLTKDTRTGAVYALFQRCAAGCTGDPKTIDYMLNRSTDGGVTWQLDGKPFGTVVATAKSSQPQPKFGTVNALLGGVVHATVDSRTGAVYYVYGTQDDAGIDRLALRKLMVNASGVVTIGPERIVTSREAAIPQIAVDDRGTIAVFYYSFDGFSASSASLPLFTARLAISTDEGATFAERELVHFKSPVADNGDRRQRVLGNHQQMKALGTCFHGVFTANGAALGRPFDNTDMVYFQVCLSPNDAVCVLASTKVDVRDRARVTANIAASQSLSVGNDVQITGNVLANANAFLGHRSKIVGDVTLAGVLQHEPESSVTGALKENTSVHLPTLTRHGVGAPCGSRTIANGTTLTPGGFGSVTIEPNARVTMAPGTYDMTSFDVGAGAVLVIPGAVSLNIQDQFVFGDRASVTSAAPHSLAIYHNGSVARIGPDAAFNGFLVAPDATINAAPRSNLRGCIAGKEITLDADSVLNAEEALLPAAFLGP